MVKAFQIHDASQTIPSSPNLQNYLAADPCRIEGWLRRWLGALCRPSWIQKLKSLQVPQHVFALLSHLSSRPGVQSTLILSRKDGSIIQSTGLLAPSQTHSSQPSRNAVASAEMPMSSPSEPASSSNSHDVPNLPDQASFANQQPYKPSQAEALAAHIHAFVLSASALSVSLSHPPSATIAEDGYHGRSSNVNGVEDGAGNGAVDEDVEEAENRDKEEGDEVKLLRLRTKKHEIVVVPDRKYLLCVVHDNCGMFSTSGGGGFFSSRV
jgi:hypothetical protein